MLLVYLIHVMDGPLAVTIGIIVNQLAMRRIAIILWLWMCVALHCSEALQYPFGNGMKDDYLIRAERLMKKTPVIDGHNVIPF